MSTEDLTPYIAYRCVVGSRAYGLEHEGSDTDLRGFYLPPAQLHWSLRGVPEQIGSEETQECYWELAKFLRLALASNPNVLECLNTPLVEHASPLAEELRGMREAFLSRLAYERYLGYAEAQLRRMRANLGAGREINWKHAMHLIRLLIAGEALLREGRLTVPVGEYREPLLAVRRGERSWPEVEEWSEELKGALRRAYETTPLPEEPDRERVDAFLIRARQAMVDA